MSCKRWFWQSRRTGCPQMPLLQGVVAELKSIQGLVWPYNSSGGTGYRCVCVCAHACICPCMWWVHVFCFGSLLLIIQFSISLFLSHFYCPELFSSFMNLGKVSMWYYCWSQMKMQVVYIYIDSLEINNNKDIYSTSLLHKKNHILLATAALLFTTYYCKKVHFYSKSHC